LLDNFWQQVAKEETQIAAWIIFYLFQIALNCDKNFGTSILKGIPRILSFETRLSVSEIDRDGCN